MTGKGSALVMVIGQCRVERLAHLGVDVDAVCASKGHDGYRAFVPRREDFVLAQFCLPSHTASAS